MCNCHLNSCGICADVVGHAETFNSCSWKGKPCIHLSSNSSFIGKVTVCVGRAEPHPSYLQGQGCTPWSSFLEGNDGGKYPSITSNKTMLVAALVILGTCALNCTGKLCLSGHRTVEEKQERVKRSTEPFSETPQSWRDEFTDHHPADLPLPLWLWSQSPMSL